MIRWVPVAFCEAVRIAARLRRAGIKAGQVSLKVKFADFQVISRQEQLPMRSDDAGELYRSAARLLEKVELRPIRLLGVHASALRDQEEQLGLFVDRKKRDKQARLNKSLDAINEKFGHNAVLPADLLAKKR